MDERDRERPAGDPLLAVLGDFDDSISDLAHPSAAWLELTGFTEDYIREDLAAVLALRTAFELEHLNRWWCL